MLPMVGSPPQDTFLVCAHGSKRQQELHDAARFERAMREITMITGRHKEHAGDVQDDTQHHICQRNAGPNRSERQEVHDKKWDARPPINGISILGDFRLFHNELPAVECVGLRHCRNTRDFFDGSNVWEQSFTKGYSRLQTVYK